MTRQWLGRNVRWFHEAPKAAALAERTGNAEVEVVDMTGYIAGAQTNDQEKPRKAKRFSPGRLSWKVRAIDVVPDTMPIAWLDT
jgi:hypothetical protein